MSAKLLPFIPARRSTPLFHPSMVAPFVLPTPPPIRCGAARLGHPRERLDRVDAEWHSAQALWLKAQARARDTSETTQPAAVVTAVASTEPTNVDAPVRAPERRSDVRLSFASVTRPSEPHPLWRSACWLAGSADRFFSGLETALLVYYTLLGLTAFPLLADANWAGGLAMVLVGTVFGWLLLHRTAPRRAPQADS